MEGIINQIIELIFKLSESRPRISPCGTSDHFQWLSKGYPCPGCYVDAKYGETGKNARFVGNWT
jgi:hypothetical protein